MFTLFGGLNVGWDVAEVLATQSNREWYP